jgi:hypothetical protein
MQTFQKMGIMVMIKKGARGDAGSKRKATYWKWIMPD